MALTSCGGTGSSYCVPNSSDEVIPDSSSSEVMPDSSSEKGYDPTNVESVVEKVVPFKTLVVDQENQKYYTSKIAVAKYYVVNGETIPYVSFNTFVKEYVNLGDSSPLYLNYECSFDAGKVLVTNPVNGSYMTFDVVTREVTYYGWDYFFSTIKYNTEPYIGSVYGSPLYNDKLTTYTYYRGKESISFSLADYSIVDYVYRGEVYLPYETLCLLFNQSISQITYAGSAFYQYSGANLDSTLAYNNLIIGEVGTGWITEDYLTSVYNNLALAYDMFCGIDERQSRVHEGTTIKYLENGAYSTLSKYKDRLTSKETSSVEEALQDLYKNDLDDGGHGNYITLNYLTDKTYQRADISGEETYNTLNTIWEIADERKKAGVDASSVLGQEAQSPNGYYKEYNGDTAYIQFDSFSMSLNEYTAESIAEVPYYTDSVTLFHYANEQIQNNSNIKNVVLDLSANGGGVMFVSEYISSWVCGGTDGTLRNTKSSSFIDYHIDADVNMDGVFNEKDYLSKDINVYVIVSNGSYSCGNKLPCNIKDNRTENTYFIGSRTGGGSCAVKYLPFSYLGGQIRISSDTQIGRKNATADKFVSNESGVEADFYKIENSNYAAFADLDTIIGKISPTKVGE